MSESLRPSRSRSSKSRNSRHSMTLIDWRDYTVSIVQIKYRIILSHTWSSATIKFTRWRRSVCRENFSRLVTPGWATPSRVPWRESLSSSRALCLGNWFFQPFLMQSLTYSSSWWFSRWTRRLELPVLSENSKRRSLYLLGLSVHFALSKPMFRWWN